MARPVVLVADTDLAAAARLVAPEYGDLDVRAAEERADWLTSSAPQAAAIVTLGAKVGADTLGAAKDLRAFVKMGRVYDHVDLDALRKKNLPLALVRRKGPNCVAELAMTLILALSKDLVVANRGVTKGLYRYRGLRPVLSSQRVMAFRWLAPANLHEVVGKTLGCVGFGEINAELSRRAQVMGMNVLYTRRSRMPEAHERLHTVAYRDLNTLFEDSDYVCIAVPHTDATHQLIGKEQLKRLGPNGYLVNVARGGIVDEAALIEALQRQDIAGAGLDVFTYEPLPFDSPLCRLHNVILTPHIGGGTGTTRDAELRVALDEVRRLLAGEAPSSPAVLP
jgi:phosphoglycerate dehydrogenase-like enzyme